MSKATRKTNRNSLQLNLLVNALIAAGLIDQIVEAPAQKADDYEFGTDDKVDAKLFPGMLRTAYTAVIGARLREEGRTEPLFDSDDDDMVETTHKPEDRELEPAKPLSYPDAQRFASAVFRMAISQGRHEDGRWLLGMTKRTVIKTDDGYHVDLTTDTPVKSFKEFLKDEKARTPADSNWFGTIVYTEQLGTDVPQWHGGVDEARAVFHEWLSEVPWTRDGLAQTRRERSVARSADRKWEALKKALLNKDGRTVSKLLDDWTLILHSPKFGTDQHSIKNSQLYKLTVARTLQEELLAEAQSLEFEKAMVETMDEIKALTASIKAERVKLQDRLNPTPAQKATQKAMANSPVKAVASLMPRTINSRRAA